MKQEERDEILIKILNSQEKLIKGQEDLDKRQEETDRVINKILNKQEETDKVINKILNNQEELFKGQDELFKGQEELFKNQKQMQEELTRLGNTVAKIEYEHGRKIDLILDVLTGHGEKIQEHDKRFEKNEKIIEMQGYKICAIEQKMKV